MSPMRTERLERAVLWAVFLAAFAYSLWLTFVGIHTTIHQEHSFRQVQTAISALFLMKGGPFLAYETPVLGPPWSIPFEFPLYQWVVAKLAALAAGPFSYEHFELVGRMVSRAFFYLALVPLYFLQRSFSIAPRHRLILLSLYLVSPMYLFWSRCFLIESTVEFFCLSYLAFALSAFQEEKLKPWLLAGTALCGALGAMVKGTTFAPFGLAVGIVYLARFSGWKEAVKRVFSQKEIPLWLAFAVFPLLAGAWWTHLSDLYKEQNPLAAFITSKALMKWNFGTLEQRLAPSTWYMFFRKTIHDSIGHRTTWMISIALFLLLPGVRRRWRLFLWTQILFLSAPMIFTNLHIAHNYYWYANGIFLVFGLALVIHELWLHGRKWKWLAPALLACALVLGVRQYLFQDYYLQQTVNDGPLKFGLTLGAEVPERDVLLIYGWDWDAAVPYYAGRRALMNRENLPLNSPEIQKALSAVRGEGRKIAALVICGLDMPEKIPAPSERERILKEFRFRYRPDLSKFCEVYL